MSHDFLRWTWKPLIFGQNWSVFFRQRKNFLNIQRIDLKSLLATQLVTSSIWQKFQGDWLARFFGKLCTNLKNLLKIYLIQKNKMWKSVKSVKKCWKSFLEVRELIFTMHNVFETCSEFDGEFFWKNRFPKKSFLKILIDPDFVIFCSILVTKIEQKITKFGSMMIFKNYFFENLFFQKNSPSNSEQVSKTLCMVKINSLTSRKDFQYFLTLFTDFIY